LAINWDKAYEDIGEKKSSSSSGGIDWDAAYSKLDTSQQPALNEGEYMEDGLIVPPSPFEMPTQTPLNQSRYNIVGQNMLPRYQEDSPLAAVGKDVVNYGIGTAGRIVGGLGQAGMQLASNIGNAVQGKPLDFSQKSLKQDILPKQYGKFVDTLATKGAAGQIASGFIQGGIEGGLDPGTWAGGLGIVDDLSRLGLAGKSATLGTAENLAANAATGLKASTKKIKGKLVPILSEQTATKGYLNAERNALKKDAIKTPDVIYTTTKGQTTDNLNRLALPAGKQQPVIKPLLLTEGNSGLALPGRATSKIELGGATTKAKEINPSDFYVDQYGHAATSPSKFPTNQPLLPAGQTAKKTVTKRIAETPGMVTPKEAKKLGLNLKSMNKPMFAGAYNKTGSADTINQIQPRANATGLEPNMYASAKGQIENPSLPLQRKIVPPELRPDYSFGKGRVDNVNTPLQGKQPFKPIELKPSTNIQPVKEVAQNGTQTVKQDGVLKGKLNKFYSATVDNTAATKRTSDQAGIMSNVARNAGGTVEHIIDKGLVNMAGQKIKGKAVREIFNMPKDQLKAFDDYMFNKLNPERIKQGKELLQHDSQTSAQIVSELEKTYPHFKQKGDEVYELLNGMLDEWGVASGLVDTDLRNIVGDMYKHYVPGYREAERVGATFTKTRSAGPAKIINRAVGGDEPLMTLSKSIPMLISKTIKASRKNEVYREIMNAARKSDNPYAKILEPVGKVEGVVEQKLADSMREAVKNDGIEGITKFVDNAIEEFEDKASGGILTIMEGGKPVKVRISQDLLKSLKALDGKTDDDLQAALRIFKKGITNPFKALITGYNPLFAVRNVARDIPTAFIQGTENNPFKFVGNLGSAAKNMIKKSDSFKEYQALGGEGGNYFNVERGLQPKWPLEKPLKAISALNNFTETLPRYGEYLGTLKREGTDYTSKMKALNNAQEVTVNFSKHGDVTKAIDAIVPYFNPAVQGIDKTVRTFKNPAAWAKALGVITVPTAGIYALNQIVDKKGYDNLDNRTKDTYFVFPMGDGKFVKVPKTREAGVIFGALFERIARQAEGQPDSFKGFGNTLKTNFMIQNPATDNIAAPVVGLKYNKDFANRNIVPQYMLNDKRSPYLQFDEQTTELAKSIGNQFNLSPKQIDYIIRSYGGIVASIAQPALTKGGNVLDKVIIRPFTADSAYSNEALNNYYSKLDKLKQTATDKNIKEGISAKKVTQEEKLSNLFQSTTRSVSDIRDGITGLGNTPEARSEQQKLLDLVRKITAAKDIYQANTAKSELSRMAKQFNK
jgi:hypothetical protein